MATASINVSGLNSGRLTLTDNTTLTLTGGYDGQLFTLIVEQDSVGSHTITGANMTGLVSPSAAAFSTNSQTFVLDAINDTWNVVGEAAGAGPITGSLTATHIPVATGATVLADSGITFVGTVTAFPGKITALGVTTGAFAAGFSYSAANAPSIGVNVLATTTDTAGSADESAGVEATSVITGSNVAGDIAIGILGIGEDTSSGGIALRVVGGEFQVATTARTALGIGVHIETPTGVAPTVLVGLQIDKQGAGIPLIRMQGSTSGAIDFIPTAAAGTGTAYTLLPITGNVAIETPAPSTATSTGVTGSIAFDATHIYVCVATNTWVRATLATF